MSKGKVFTAQEHFEQQYCQQFIGQDAGKDISPKHFPKYRHKKTGKIVEAEYAKAYHGEWLYWVKNPVEKEHKVMSPKWFNEEYEGYEK